MRYYVSLKGNEHVVDLEEKDGRLSVRFDDRPVDADLVPLHASGLYSLLLGGHSREMVLDREGERVFVSLDGERIEVRVQDDVSRALAAFRAAPPTGPSDVTAPMPGVVVGVPVKVGDEIEVGQPVIIVEAMKMQNELAAEVPGIVSEIRVAAGDAVDGGQVLVVLAAKKE
ncbi:MAG: biotin/lipoyl-containing protein [bacterium]